MIFWKFILTDACERIRVVRDNKVFFDGTVPHPWPMSLTLGDKVYVKKQGKHWRKKFELVMWRDRPSMRFGTYYGNKEQHKHLFLKQGG